MDCLFVISLSLSLCLSMCLCGCGCMMCVATMAFSLASSQQPRLISSPSPVMQQAMRSPAPGQQPNLMPHLIRQIQSQQALMQGANQHAALMQQSPESGGFFYAPYEYSPYTLTPSILEYPMDTTGVLGMAFQTKG
uniref:Uncharacterized protein n=1 Tax=Hucho hucho TaxID=62062 RepID=A0A4W5LLU9_9TELE